MRKSIHTQEYSQSDLTQYLQRRVNSSWHNLLDSWVADYREVLDQLYNIYPQDNMDGYIFRIHVSDDHKTHRRCFPRIEDLLSPLRKIELTRVKAVIIWGEPMPNGASTPLPFYYDAQYYQPNKSGIVQYFSKAIGFIEYWLMAVRNSAVSATPKDAITIESFDPHDWLDQGVLLLHASWTTEENTTSSHSKMWENCVSSLLQGIQNYNPSTIFVAMGSQAQAVISKLDDGGSVILTEDPEAMMEKTDVEFHKTTNPFVIINRLLTSLGKSEIRW